MGSGLEKKHRDTVAIQENNPFNTGETGLVLWPPPSKILTPRWVPPPHPKPHMGKGTSSESTGEQGLIPMGGSMGHQDNVGVHDRKGGSAMGWGGGGPF